MRRGILATRDELSALREKLTKSPFSALYARLQKRCSLILESSPVTERQWQAAWGQGQWGAAVRAARIVQGRIWDLLIAHHIDANRAYRDRAIEELKELVRWGTWTDPCYQPLPADLCTGEAALGAAVALDWLWEDLGQADRLRVLQAIRHKALEPYRKALREKVWWTSCYHNWNAVVNGGCGLAGLALGDDEPDAEEAYLAARSQLQHFFDAFGREGGWDEGLGYWAYAMRFLVLFGEAAGRLVDDQRVFHARGMDATGLFPVYFTPNGQPASFGDNPGSPTYGALYLLVRHFGLRELRWWLDTYAFAHDVSTTAPASAGLALLFRPDDGEAVDPSGLSPLRLFHEIGWAAMADAWPRPGMYVAAKTGDLAANHSHRDMNAMQLQADGEMLMIDLGSPPYSRKYFSEERGAFYEVQARGHNTITVAERDHRIDAQGRIIEAQSDGHFRWVACDAGDACGENVRFIRHVVMLVDGAGRGQAVVVLDDVTNAVPETVHQYWHVGGRIEMDAERRAGTIRGQRAALHFALGATVPSEVVTESHELGNGRSDFLLRVSAGVTDRALFATVFTRQGVGGDVRVRVFSSGAELKAGGVHLHFKARKNGLILDQAAMA